VASVLPGNEPLQEWKDAHDLWLEAFILFNFLCLTGDILLAHAANSFRNHWEYLPVWFSPLAAAVLAIGLFLRVRSQRVRLWSLLGTLVAWLSIALGAAGLIFHLDSHFFYERTIRSLTYAAPVVAPLAYMGLGCLLLMNRMVATRSEEWAKWVLFFAMGGFARNFVLSLTDHAINGFFHRSEWIPVVSSALATRPQRLLSNIVSGAPPFAPLLLPNLAILGFLGLAASKNHQPAEGTG
jgi:hypothetical protein